MENLGWRHVIFAIVSLWFAFQIGCSKNRPTPPQISAPREPEVVELDPLGLAYEPVDLPDAGTADVSGEWVWEARGYVENGDLQKEFETWEISQNADRLSGSVERAMERVSMDGRAYRCNQELTVRRASVVSFVGKVDGISIQIEETDAKPLTIGACDNGERKLYHYKGRYYQDEIIINWVGGAQVLKRKDATKTIPTQSF